MKNAEQILKSINNEIASTPLKDRSLIDLVRLFSVSDRLVSECARLRDMAESDRDKQANALIDMAGRLKSSIEEAIQAYPVQSLSDLVYKARIAEMNDGLGYIGNPEMTASMLFALVRDIERLAGVPTPSAKDKVLDISYGISSQIQGKIAA